MKKTSFLLAPLVALVTTFAYGDVLERKYEEAERLTRAIQKSLRWGQVRPQKIDAVITSLRQVVGLIEDQSEHQTRFRECKDFAFQTYDSSVGTSAADALDKAIAFCKKPYLSLNVIKFAVAKYHDTAGVSAAEAMDKAFKSCAGE